MKQKKEKERNKQENKWRKCLKAKEEKTQKDRKKLEDEQNNKQTGQFKERQNKTEQKNERKKERSNESKKESHVCLGHCLSSAVCPIGFSQMFFSSLNVTIKQSIITVKKSALAFGTSRHSQEPRTRPN